MWKKALKSATGIDLEPGLSLGWWRWRWRRWEATKFWPVNCANCELFSSFYRPGARPSPGRAGPRRGNCLVCLVLPVIIIRNFIWKWIATRAEYGNTGREAKMASARRSFQVEHNLAVIAFSEVYYRTRAKYEEQCLPNSGRPWHITFGRSLWTLTWNSSKHLGHFEPSPTNYISSLPRCSSNENRHSSANSVELGWVAKVSLVTFDEYQSPLPPSPPPVLTLNTRRWRPETAEKIEYLFPKVSIMWNELSWNHMGAL